MSEPVRNGNCQRVKLSGVSGIVWHESGQREDTGADGERHEPAFNHSGADQSLLHQSDV